MGALPPPAACPLGGLSGFATHVLWARVCGRGGPALSLWLVCPAGGCMPRRWWGAVPGGMAFHCCEGRLVLKRYPEPMALGPEAGGPSHPLWPMAWRSVSRHTPAEAVDAGCQWDIPVL